MALGDVALCGAPDDGSAAEAGQQSRDGGDEHKRLPLAQALLMLPGRLLRQPLMQALSLLTQLLLLMDQDLLNGLELLVLRQTRLSEPGPGDHCRRNPMTC